MLLATALKGMQEARDALQTQEGISNPTFISEQTQRLAQYTGATEAILSEDESELLKKSAAKFKSYMEAGKSANMADNLLKYDFVDERAQVIKLTRLCNSSWKIISVSQSRVKHLIAEALNQV
jgi:hypothetical protein